MAVGVGGGIALNNLQAISGPTVNKDYAVAAKPGDLDALLKQLATTICPADLGITKSGPDDIEPGNIIKYDITVTNGGSVTVPFASIKVTDPSATTLTAPSAAPLAPGESLVWKATKDVANNEKLCNTTVSNTATVALVDLPGYNEPDTTNNTATKDTKVLCPLDVSILKTATSKSVEPGGSATYDVTVKNTGNWTVPFNRIVIDDPDAALTPPALTTDLAPNATRTWTAVQKVPADAVCGSDASNTASVSLKAPDPTLVGVAAVVDPRSSTATTPVICPVDVTVAKTTPSTTVVPGGTVPYSITVTNPSAFAVPFSAISVTDDGATITPPADITDLAPGAERVWTATKVAADGTAACGTTVTNTAQVALVGLPEGYSAITPGGSSSVAPGVTIAGGICIPPVVVVTTPDAPVAIAALPQLLVRKSGPAIARKGSAVTYKIKVTNRGPRVATNVTITDTPPRSMLIGGTPQGATRSGRTLTWALGDLAVGASRTVTVTLGMRLTASGTPCNIATATASDAAAARGKACTRVQAVRDPRVTG